VLEGGAPARTETPARAPGHRRNPLAWLLGLLLLLALAGLVLESRRAAELGARVEGLSAELQASRASLDAHRRHLGQVRASVEALEASLAELRALVSRDPAPADPAAPPPEAPAR
jgi:hypothetical protein